MTPVGASSPGELRAWIFNRTSTRPTRPFSDLLVNIESSEAFRDVAGGLLGAVSSAGVSAATYLAFIPLPLHAHAIHTLLAWRVCAHPLSVRWMDRSETHASTWSP